MPIREPRDRSRERSMDRGLYLEDDLYGRPRQSKRKVLEIGREYKIPILFADLGADRAFLGDLQHQHTDLQRELGNLKRELELTNQKLSSSMHSIKTFWSPELKKERALRKEESAKYSLINDQLKLLNSENQVIKSSCGGGTRNQYVILPLNDLIAETSHVGTTTGGGVKDADASAKY